MITQVKAELAGFEGREQRVPLLEARLRAMPNTGFMDSSPRERLEAELAEARANLPRPGEVAKARADLAAYEAQLTSTRASRPRPSGSELARLEQQLQAVEAASRVDMVAAAEEKRNFVRLRAQALGFVELLERLDGIVNMRRLTLAGATGTPRAFAQCLTMQGPFRCTGSFDGSWNRRCTTPTRTFDDRGPARVTFGADGWVEVQFTSANPQQGDPPVILGGRISADGKVAVQRTSPGQSESYRGDFKLVTTTLASGAAKPIGSGTYENVWTHDQDFIRANLAAPTGAIASGPPSTYPVPSAPTYPTPQATPQTSPPPPLPEPPVQITQASGACAGFAGDWNSDFGAMQLAVQGSRARGTYTQPGGTIEGTVVGNVLEGRWVQRDRSGILRFVLGPGARGFTGTWREANGSGGGYWNGMCTGGVTAATPPSPAQPQGNTGAIAGTPPPPPPQPAQGGTWSRWISPDEPGATADYDWVTFPNDAVACVQPVAVECRVRSDKRDWRQAGQRYKCAIEGNQGGGICVNAENPGGCLDYEVRFLCPAR